jgi:hypothetical protein
MVRGRAALAALALLCAAGCTAPNPAYMMETPCEVGARQCVMSPRRAYPVVCGRDDSGSLALLDERCPTPAACQAGLCQAPTGAKACARQGDCAKTEVCVPLVGEGRALAAVCLPAAAAIAAPGQRCELDEDCQSYLCLPFRTGNRCLKTCATALDCEIPDECRSLNITVTGVAGAIKSCLPRS